jgi:long-chain acyl-CoA synthetase
LPIFIGARITVIESIKPFHRLLKNLFKNRVTIFMGIPQMFKLFSQATVPKILTWRIFSWLNPLRICISGADKLPVEVYNAFQRRFHIPLLEGYGLTEASPVVSLNPLRGRRKIGSVGLPLPDVEVKVVSEDGRALPPGQVGELVVKGPNVMKGYLNLPQATEEVIKDGWLYTGDFAKIDEDGFIYIVDRKKDLIIVHGFNVYPKEIEDVLYLHPKVAEAAVIGVKDLRHGELPKAFIVLKPAQEASREEILDFCRSILASYKMPRYIEFRTSLPKTATGKVEKRILRAQQQKGD